MKFSLKDFFSKCDQIRMARVTQAWNVFVNNFHVQNLFFEPTKNLCNWVHITIPFDTDMFHTAVHCFPFQNRVVFQNRWWMMDEWRPQREVWRVFQLFLASHLPCCDFNSDLIPLEFTVFQVNIFLPFYPHFHLLFPIIKIFLTGFYSMATGFHRLFIMGK